MEAPTPKESLDATLLYNDEQEPSLKDALCNRKLWKVTMYGMFIAFAFRLPAIVMPILGAKYFDDDSSDDNNNNTTGCNSKGNATYAMWNSLCSCIGGALGFLFESYLGRLSDAYGRKVIMAFTWFALFVGNASMCFTDNVWFYLILFPVTSLAGLFSGMPTVLASALSDCVIPKHKTIIFALLFGMAGFVSVLGSTAAAIITNVWGIKAPFFAFIITMAIALIWLIFIVDETLPKQNRVKLNEIEYGNKPWSPLFKLKENKVILWVSIMALITCIPESGIDDMISSYTDDILSLCNDDKKAADFNAISGISMGVTMLISQLIVIPILAKHFGDILLFFLVLLAILGFMSSGIIAYLWPGYVTGILIWVMFGLSFITSPITNGCLAKRLTAKEQGLGMGILHAMKGLTFAIAPYTFGGLYDLFTNKGILKTMPFMFGFIFVLIGAIILFGPLKRTLNTFDDNKIREGLVPVADTHVVQQ